MAVPFESVLKAAQEYVSSNVEALKTTSWSGIGKSLGALKQTPSLRWASVQDIKSAVEQAYTDAFGSKEQNQAAQKQQKVHSTLYQVLIHNTDHSFLPSRAVSYSGERQQQQS